LNVPPDRSASPSIHPTSPTSLLPSCGFDSPHDKISEDPSSLNDLLLSSEDDLRGPLPPDLPSDAVPATSLIAPLSDEANDCLDNTDVPIDEIVIEEIKLADQMISLLREASINADKLPESAKDRLRNTPHELNLTADKKLSLDLFLATQHAPQDVYENVRLAVQKAHPDDHILSYYEVLKELENITGIIAVKDDR
jgi:hypothetical protein